MRILITGAAGFLGSHLCERLLKDGHQVVGMDNFVTGSPDNLTHLAGNPNFLFIRHDVSNFIFVPGKVDAVMHFASPASPNPASPYGYTNLPIQTMKAGALGTHNTLGVAIAHRARYLLASTSEIYGDPLEHPQRESYWGHVDPIGVRSVYDEAKRFAEALTMAYHRYHGLDTRIVRIFNTYGPRMRLDDGRVVPNFIQQALRHEPLTVYGEGNQTRSFCYVDDLIEGIIRLLLSDEHEPVNIGNPVETTILELARTINEIIGNPSGIVYKPALRLGDDPQRRRPDITRARTILKWEPTTSLHEGIQRTIPYFKQKMGLE
ncbi:MAG TPA: SDR family NAD-dependent epimerase/dehydratase [Anaerolinea thermolimosa]|uniref:UDP-glucuronate decarboxylase n=1 Tax=Anaerolinea thermolimosa TaxID=229919 RepID=A0A3D1JHB5_9CHLR|nr:UDP-glucuronic acid decarboxylase family protein [Anaerolinea thermolimosa]GAP06273.1 nucleoside-diphosphate-sugar epimerase [Anaerolinea thermolimosa]HCE17883.1 SDR family NAD-dependent epimerase/dehydratase [Anaerolinea thermolimosa]